MGTDTLTKVDWAAPGMEKFTERELKYLRRCIEQEDIVCSIHSLGWALWPTTNRGYYDSDLLRKIADFLEIQNKIYWKGYDEEEPENSA